MSKNVAVTSEVQQEEIEAALHEAQKQGLPPSWKLIIDVSHLVLYRMSSYMDDSNAIEYLLLLSQRFFFSGGYLCNVDRGLISIHCQHLIHLLQLYNMYL